MTEVDVPTAAPNDKDPPMKVRITLLNSEQCQVLLTETPKQGLVMVCATDPTGSETILGRFDLSGTDLPIAVPMGFDRHEDLSRLVLHEYSSDSQRAYTHTLSAALVRWLMSRQVLHANVYREPRKAVQRIAAVTIAYNEDFILPKWVDYYGKQLGCENLYVIDDGSDVKPRTYLPPAVNVVQQPRTSFDSWRLSRSLGIFQRLLLETYDVVIVTDSDEFIVVADPRFRDLREYLMALDITRPRRLVPTGWELTHLRSSQAPLDLSRPIVEQRKSLLRNEVMDKVAIFNESVSFTPGQHRCYEKTERAEDLHLIHLRFFDYDFSRRKLERYRSTQWAAGDLAAGLSFHQRKEFSELDEEFAGFERKYAAPDNAHPHMELQPSWIEQLAI